MKLKGAKQVHYDAGPNMTPLVDVVMVILIFLMLAGSFGENEHFLLSSIPIKNGGGDAVPDPKSKTQDYNIRVDGTADGHYTAVVNNTVCSDLNTLNQTLHGDLAGMLANGTGVDDIQVIIDPSADVAYKYLLEVYQAALDAKFTKVAFAQGH